MAHRKWDERPDRAHDYCKSRSMPAPGKQDPRQESDRRRYAMPTLQHERTRDRNTSADEVPGVQHTESTTHTGIKEELDRKPKHHVPIRHRPSKKKVSAWGKDGTGRQHGPTPKQRYSSKTLLTDHQRAQNRAPGLQRPERCVLITHRPFSGAGNPMGTGLYTGSSRHSGCSLRSCTDTDSTTSET